MTAICYPDLRAASPDGRFVLEAVSPDNGTIPRRDGRIPDAEDFGFKYREHQAGFRYRFFRNGETLWERWQHPGEDSPGELVADDDGWAVLRTDGFGPEVIAVRPDGRDAVCVQVMPTGGAWREDVRADSPAWTPERMWHTSAGLYWSANSWRDFFTHSGRRYFFWRVYWGQRLLIDLDAGTLLEPGAADPLYLAMLAAERRGASELLDYFADRMSEVRRYFAEKDEDDPFGGRLGRVTAALHLAGLHGLTDVEPRLRDWEDIDVPSRSGSSAALPKYWLEYQVFRPVVRLSLQRLGFTPRGFAAYRFTDLKRRARVPECIADRDTLLSNVRADMTAAEVLRRVGAPDHVRREPSEGSPGKWMIVESWDYDRRVADGWETVRLNWLGRRDRGVLRRVETVPATWLNDDERDEEIFGW